MNKQLSRYYQTSIDVTKSPLYTPLSIKHARHALGREFRGLGYTRHIRTNVRILGNSEEFPTIYSEETHDTPLPVVCMLDSGLRKRA